MKLITLNVWGGKRWDDLADFLRRQAKTTDMFCFQEVTSAAYHQILEPKPIPGYPYMSDLFEQLQQVLPNFTGHFGRELIHMAGTDIDYGSAVFVRTSHPHRYASTFAYGREEDRTYQQAQFEFSSRILQTVVTEQPAVAIHSFHGIWIGKGKGKGDCPARLEQSKNILHAMQAYPLPQILCGDFNLSPDTESLALLAQGRRNLISDFGIPSTRSHLYDKPDNPYADYVIVSPEVQVETFTVLPDVVSDHLALQLEFTI